MKYATAKKSLEAVYPFLTKNFTLNFYGGEPLLAFPLIERTVTLLETKNRLSGKKGTYSITTNAGLLNDEICKFFSRHRFSVEVSFDGLVQNMQKEKKSTPLILANIRKLLCHSGIKTEVNSVFTNQTVGYLSESMKYLIAQDIPHIRFSLDAVPRWNRKALRDLEIELAKLGRIVTSHHREHKSIPVGNYKEYEQKGIFHCNAGRDRLAVSPGGDIWGCFLFYDFFRKKPAALGHAKYFFGNIADFMKNPEGIHAKISPNYAPLSMNNFSTRQKDCLFCPYLAYCRICPIAAALSGEEIGRVPLHLCRIKKTLIETAFLPSHADIKSIRGRRIAQG